MRGFKGIGGPETVPGCSNTPLSATEDPSKLLVASLSGVTLGLESLVFRVALSFIAASSKLFS